MSEVKFDEKWVSIEGYFNRYEVSNFGRVRSISYLNKHGKWTVRKDPKILSETSCNGYRRVSLFLNNKGRHLLVHRIVARAFLGELPEGLEVAHLDGNRINNHIDNLKYVTRKENHSHKSFHGTRQVGEKANNTKLKEHEVLNILSLLEKGVSRKMLSVKYKVNLSTIGLIARKRNWSYLHEKALGAQDA